MTRPLILLANDDGYAALGIQALADALERTCDVVLVAPETEQSATSHALTMQRPLRIRKLAENRFAVDGTPADCVYLALFAEGRLLPRRPDAVVSGINHGLNLGQDVFYSGTVAAAREGALRGITALAVSGAVRAAVLPELRTIAAYVAVLVHRIALCTDLRGVLLNANFPVSWTGGIRRTVLGARNYEDLVDLRNDPRGREYAWIGGPPRPDAGEPGTDASADASGDASVTPLLLDLTDHGALWPDRGSPARFSVLDEILRSVRPSH